MNPGPLLASPSASVTRGARLGDLQKPLKLGLDISRPASKPPDSSKASLPDFVWSAA